MSAQPKHTAEERLPGDLSRDQLVDRIVRVDQAGEYGAVRIYEGQLAVLGNRPAGPVIRKMAAQEQEHLDKFNAVMGQKGVRPTALGPVWHAAGFALGAATALIGDKAAMACTEAVEQVIDDHYAAQEAMLGDDEAPLRALISEARADEAAHRETAIAEGAEQAPGHTLLTGGIRSATKLAIWLSERV